MYTVLSRTGSGGWKQTSMTKKPPSPPHELCPRGTETCPVLNVIWSLLDFCLHAFGTLYEFWLLNFAGFLLNCCFWAHFCSVCTSQSSAVKMSRLFAWVTQMAPRIWLDWSPSLQSHKWGLPVVSTIWFHIFFNPSLYVSNGYRNLDTSDLWFNVANFYLSFSFQIWWQLPLVSTASFISEA